MKYSNRHILASLNENIFTKQDMREQYKFSDLPVLKRIVDMIYVGENNYNKWLSRFMLIRSYQLQPPEYLPDAIKQSIQNMGIQSYGGRFSIQDRIFDIRLILDARKKIMHHEIDEHFKKIYIWLHIASEFASHQCSKYMKINMYFTSHKKLLPNKYEAIDREHANTAFTTSCQLETEINIFREEEWFKTFIHETFHSMGMDFSASGSQYTNQLLSQFIPIETDFRVYETYTECWAEIIHSLFVAHYHTKKHGSAIMISTFNQVLNNERRFAVFQCEKILNHYSMKFEDIYKHNVLSSRRRENYKEHTHILSYYILKMVVMYNAKEFMIWNAKNNGLSINFNHKMQTSHKKQKSFVQFIEKRLKKTEMEHMLAKANQYIADNHNKKNTTMQTLRMTVHEIL
jgi:hypothetical protein